MRILDRKILIVEDEEAIREMLLTFLRKEGFTKLFEASSYKEALTVFNQVKPHVGLFDVMLSDGDGFQLIQEVRKQSDMPVLFVTAKGEDQDRLLGLGLGADDYLVKPFLPKELILRLKAILNRTYGSSRIATKPSFKLQGREIDLEKSTVFYHEEEIILTAKENGLLRKLYENKGRIVTCDALCQAVWGDDYYGYENTLMVHIRRLRRKIEIEPSKPKNLLTHRGLGYRLLVEED